MGDIANMMLDGTMCCDCGEVFEDQVNGKRPPGYPRSCCVVPAPVKKAKTKKRRKGKSSEEQMLAALATWPVRIYDNNGAAHHKYFGRFNYWPSRGKWWDSITNIKGQGLHSFITYVQDKVETLNLKQENNHDQQPTRNNQRQNRQHCAYAPRSWYAHRRPHGHRIKPSAARPT